MGKDKDEKKAKKAKKEEALDEDDKAAKKAKKEAKKAKREAEAAAVEEAPPAKKSKKDKSGDDDEDKPKLSKEEKAAKKAAKEAKKAAKEGGEEAPAAPPAVAAAPAPAAGGEEGTRLFVGNLPFKMTEEWLTSVFEGVGKISNIDWLMHTDTGKWKGAVFCEMATAAEASAAAAKLNGQDCEGRPMKVEIAAAKKARPAPTMEENDPSESVFVGNMSWSVDEESTRKLFADCGAISRIKWLEKDGEFRGMAFIDFETVEAATKAVALNGSDLCGRAVRINFSKPKTPTAGGGDKWGSGGGGKWGAGGGTTPNGKPQRPTKPTGEKPAGCVELFCGNLPWSVDEAKVTEFFAKAGATVTGTRWLNDKETGEFKGIGFVTFADTADVDKAVGLGGEMLDGRTIRLDYAGAKKKEGAWQGGGGGW